MFEQRPFNSLPHLQELLSDAMLRLLCHTCEKYLHVYKEHYELEICSDAMRSAAGAEDHAWDSHQEFLALKGLPNIAKQSRATAAHCLPRHTPPARSSGGTDTLIADKVRGSVPIAAAASAE